MILNSTSMSGSVFTTPALNAATYFVLVLFNNRNRYNSLASFPSYCPSQPETTLADPHVLFKGTGRICFYDGIRRPGICTQVLDGLP
jgi:hypothetical protein